MLVTAAYLGARQLVVQEAEAILDAPRACGQRLDGRRDVVHDGQAGGRGVGVVGLRGSPVLPREPQRQRGLVDFLRRRPPLGPLSFLLPLGVTRRFANAVQRLMTYDLCFANAT